MKETTMIDEFARLAAKATQGQVDIDTVENDGAYGSGPDVSHGFNSYALYDDKGRVILDTINSDNAEVHVEYDEDGANAWDDVANHNLTFIAWCFNHRAEIAALIAKVSQ